jgi:hypothetical protein
MSKTALTMLCWCDNDVSNVEVRLSVHFLHHAAQLRRFGSVNFSTAPTRGSCCSDQQRKRQKKMGLRATRSRVASLQVAVPPLALSSIPHSMYRKPGRAKCGQRSMRVAEVEKLP